MQLTIGRRLKKDVESLEEASRIYGELRDQSGEGASTFPDGRIRDGKTTYRISYNGKVWITARALVFDPYKTLEVQS